MNKVMFDTTLVFNWNIVATFSVDELNNSIVTLDFERLSVMLFDYEYTNVAIKF